MKKSAIAIAMFGLMTFAGCAGPDAMNRLAYSLSLSANERMAPIEESVEETPQWKAQTPPIAENSFETRSRN